MKRAYTDIPEGQVHYVTEGTGEPVLLLHESPRSWVTYARMIPLLGKTHRVIAMDTLGFGNSDPPPRDFRVEDYAESVVHFMDSLQIDKTNLAGNRTSATIAVEVAVRWPERVTRLIIDGLPFWNNTEERVARLEETKGRDLEAEVVDGSHCSRLWQRFLAGVPGGGKDGLTEEDLEFVAGYTIDALRAGPRWKAIDVNISFSYEPNPRLPLIKAPTLVIGVTGEGPNWYTKRPHEVSALIPESTVGIIEGGDRRVKIVQAKEMVETIRRFLETPMP